MRNCKVFLPHFQAGHYSPSIFLFWCWGDTPSTYKGSRKTRWNTVTLLVFGIGVATTSARVQRTNGVAPPPTVSGLAYTSCDFAMESTPDLSSDSEEASNDFLEDVLALVGVEDFTTTHNEDGTNNVTAEFGAENMPEADLASLVNTWLGLTVNGTLANWTFEAATCQGFALSCAVSVSSTPPSNESVALSGDIVLAEFASIGKQFPGALSIGITGPIIPIPNTPGSYNVTSFSGVRPGVTEEDVVSFAILGRERRLPVRRLNGFSR
ncbi:hypothetical protein D9757_004561 [Collybiopsis confluens]|uniref:Uncharacterized protein n=1 Tax=Collybiopsis confluens TaxID=2823264 RepID=A0A8H5HWI9_9AGAR|nr:hypothetical protein D9757_004561 [Collybiopsis confluens]